MHFNQCMFIPCFEKNMYIRRNDPKEANRNICRIIVVYNYIVITNCPGATIYEHTMYQGLLILKFKPRICKKLLVSLEFPSTNKSSVASSMSKNWPVQIRSTQPRSTLLTFDMKDFSNASTIGSHLNLPDATSEKTFQNLTTKR